MSKGLNNWLSAIAMLSMLFVGAASAQSYTLAESQGKAFAVNAKSAVTIQIANANLEGMFYCFQWGNVVKFGLNHAEWSLN